MENEENIPIEKPPFLKSWKNIYLMVMIVFAILVVLFALISNSY